MVRNCKKRLDVVLKDSVKGAVLMIDLSKISRKTVDSHIADFDKEFGESENVLKDLFEKPDNMNFDDIFIRVSLIDLLYSTGVQRFNKGGVTNLSKHIQKYGNDIDLTQSSKTIDYELFEKLIDVDYSSVLDLKGQENRVSSFVSKYLNFCNPGVYPIMDSYVKRAIGISENCRYKDYCSVLLEFKSDFEKKVYGKISLKELDKFLWMFMKNPDNT